MASRRLHDKPVKWAWQVPNDWTATYPGNVHVLEWLHRVQGLLNPGARFLKIKMTSLRGEKRPKMNSLLMSYVHVNSGRFLKFQGRERSSCTYFGMNTATHWHLCSLSCHSWVTVKTMASVIQPTWSVGTPMPLASFYFTGCPGSCHHRMRDFNRTPLSWSPVSLKETWAIQSVTDFLGGKIKE